MKVLNNFHSPAYQGLYRGPKGTPNAEKVVKDIAKILKTPTDEFGAGGKISPVHWVEKKGLDIYIEPTGITSAKVELVRRKFLDDKKVVVYADIGKYAGVEEFNVKDIKTSCDKKSAIYKNTFYGLCKAIALVSLLTVACLAIKQKGFSTQKDNPVQQIEKTFSETVNITDKVLNDTIK